MTTLTMPRLLSYGAFALPLAMVALPIYVYLPQFYAQRAGLSLASIGALLLAARVAAAFIDPLLGWWIGRGAGRYARYVAIGAAPLLAGFVALFHPPAGGSGATLAWFFGTLMLTYFGFGVATIAHQSWGAALTQAPRERARVTGVRETCGLAGVVLAAAVSATGAGASYNSLCLAFAVSLLGAGALLLARAPRAEKANVIASTPAREPPRFDGTGLRDLALPFGQRPFRALFAVLMVNGVAAAIPATLFLFFVADRLHLAAMSGLFLILYFASAAASIALWVRAAGRYGEARAWAASMLLAALVFVWSFWLGQGAALAFGIVCVLSGAALGADLALPPALLAGVIAGAGDSGSREAAYFGVWNWGVQMTLALAAGIALPLLGAAGYTPGASGPTTTLAAAYALLPCVLKLGAAAMLWRAPLRHY